jgi:hypothetical protein
VVGAFAVASEGSTEFGRCEGGHLIEDAQFHQDVAEFLQAVADHRQHCGLIFKHRRNSGLGGLVKVVAGVLMRFSLTSR